ncbi:MAG TPA: hypothetical protein VK769_00745, partial [Verrucomicrobiae bacterium]|nr:hypothetical protein [Verrucomicrobiae bacterium]
IGFGLSILLTISAAANFILRKQNSARTNQIFPRRFHQTLLLAPWFGLLFYCAKSGMDTAARLISPYYPLLIPLLLISAAQSEIVRHRWWRVLVYVNLILAFAVLILTPGRELWPAQTVLSKALELNPNQTLLLRAQKVYSTYANRSDPLACVRDLLPQNISVVGFASAADDADISLWQPLGTRRVEQFLLTDSPPQIHEQKIQFAVISGAALDQENMTLDDWLKKSGAELIATTNAVLKVSGGEQQWHVVRFKN